MSLETPRLRLATVADAAALLPLAEKLFNQSVYSTFSTFDSAFVYRALRRAVEGDLSQSGILLLETPSGPVGCLGMARTGFMGKPELAIETVFWVEPEYRNMANMRQLLGAYFYWAKKVGCKAALVGKLKDKHQPEYYIVRKL